MYFYWHYCNQQRRKSQFSLAWASWSTSSPLHSVQNRLYIVFRNPFTTPLDDLPCDPHDLPSPKSGGRDPPSPGLTPMTGRGKEEGEEGRIRGEERRKKSLRGRKTNEGRRGGEEGRKRGGNIERRRRGGKRAVP